MSIKIENVEVVGWEPAIRGMRYPKNSWHLSDSNFHARRDIRYHDDDVMCFYDEDGHPFMMDGVDIGPNDHTLMMNLAHGGPVHAKYRRMIVVYMDITAPLYWWKECDTYKVGTVANSCSTMHKIHDKEFTLDDFSHEHLLPPRALRRLLDTIDELNFWRDIFLNGGMVDWEDGTSRIYKPKEKDAWWQMIQLLPSSYNQKRTVMMSYEVLTNMHDSREFHKLDCWREFDKVIKNLPYSELITGEKLEDGE
jgi:hypothetical protein